MSETHSTAAEQPREIITRAEARERGLKNYYTGLPCKHGHVAERLASNRSCNVCSSIKNAKWKEANAGAIVAYSAAYYAERKAAICDRKKGADKANTRAAQMKWLQNNQQKAREVRSRYLNSKKGRSSGRRWSALRRARKSQAMPHWYGEFDDFVWREASNLVALREAATSIDWHADHMIPLAAESASGLHVWNNCQVIPGRLNESKKNRMVITGPGEWLQHL